MINLFVDKNAEIVVTLFVGKNQEGKTVAWTANIPEGKPEGFEASSKGIEKYKICFRLPTFKDNSEISDGAFSVDKDGKFSVRTNEMDYLLFSKLLKSWDFKDENGDIPVTAENVAGLNTVIARAIVSDLNKQLLA